MDLKEDQHQIFDRCSYISQINIRTLATSTYGDYPSKLSKLRATLTERDSYMIDYL